MNRNKKWLIVCIMLLWGSIDAFALEKDTLAFRQEVSFGIGTQSAFGTLVEYVGHRDYSLGLEIHGQYLHNVSNHVGIGVLGGFESYRDSDGNSYKASVTINAIARLYWFNHKHFAMYSKLGVGALLGFEGKDGAIPVINISPIGIEFGDGEWRGFTELFTIGATGVFNIGIKHSF